MMKPLLVWMPMLLLGSFSTAAIAWTPRDIPSFEPGRCCLHAQQRMQTRQYDPTTVETIVGEVTNVNYVGQQGVHLVVQTQSETIDVHLGPDWYLEEQNFVVAIGDRIEVTGSRIDGTATPELIAAQVKLGEENLTLRDANGFPVWRGRGQRIP